MNGTDHSAECFAEWMTVLVPAAGTEGMGTPRSMVRRTGEGQYRASVEGNLGKFREMGERKSEDIVGEPLYIFEDCMVCRGVLLSIASEESLESDHHLGDEIMNPIPGNTSPDNPVWSAARERYRRVPLGLQLCRFLFSLEPTAPLPLPGKPWVALACDPNDERFYRMEFCSEEPGPEDFEYLLLNLFDDVKARPEFVEVVDADIAIDIAPFCRALDIRIDLPNTMPMADSRIELIRSALVADVSRRDDDPDAS